MRYAVALMAGVLAAPAFAADALPGPVAKIVAHAVAHPAEKATVRVPRTARYIGGDRFALYGVADCEIHLFAEADPQRRVRKLYWIQFESYLPSRPELSYNYADGNTGITIGGMKVWVRARPASTTGPVREGSDRAHVLAILKAGGYTVPPEVMNVRMVRMLDDPAGTGKGRHELMVIYSEDLAPTGKTAADLTKDGVPDERWTPLEEPLIDRASKAVTVQRR